MRENKIRTIWNNGGTVINTWLHIPSSWSVEVLANEDWDSLTVDMQHGMLGIESVIQMFQAISTTDTVPLVRVNWNDPGEIMKVLDAGAYGVICPMINNRKECEAFVGAARYYPQGYRSLGPTRARVYAGADYGNHANETVITMAMIETDEALENVDEIVSTPGLDAIYVGPGDLSLCIRGVGGIDIEDPIFLAALEKIVSACQRHGVVAGIHTNDPTYAKKMIAMGFRFVTVLTDTRMLSMVSKDVLGQMKSVESAEDNTGVY